MSNGFVAWEGPSQINGESIVAIVTWKSRNAKTADMNHLWILAAAEDPWTTLRAGKDESICGTCELRAGNGCYVQVPQAPLSIWRAWQRGTYPTLWNEAELARRPARLGAYGDPAAVPYSVLERIAKASPGWTGYTHQWRDRRFKDLRNLCMASVQNVQELVHASWKGWRCYRVRPPESEIMPIVERGCPAAKENGAVLTCAACLYCGGLLGKGTGHVTSEVHGLPVTIKRAMGSIS